MLAGLMLRHGIPKHIRSDNGPEFVAKAVRQWLSRLGVETLFIEPGSPWENGYIENFKRQTQGRTPQRGDFHDVGGVQRC